MNETAQREAIRRLAQTMLTNEEPEEKPGSGAVLVTSLVALGAVFPLAYLRGWVAVKLWDWFGAPIWPSVHLTIYSAVGLMLVTSAFKSHHDFKPEEDKSLSKAWSNLIASACWPLALLGVAWLWTWLAWGQ